MLYDSNNKIVKLCAKGMSLEGEGENEEALKLFQQAWDESTNNFEKFTAAHYVARQQKNVQDKLHWDKLALELALQIRDESIKATFPSLYLNIAKCYEDLGDKKNAIYNYEKANSFIRYLGSDGYGKMIKNGIVTGMQRASQKT